MSSRRPSLADLPTVAPSNAPPPRVGPSQRVAVHRVAPNPVNPRKTIGDLTDLESMRESQIQACIVVTCGAFLNIYPEHAAAVGAAEFVVLAGSRRRLAAEHFGIPDLLVDVRDELAESRRTFRRWALAENIDRNDLDPIDLATELAMQADDLGSQDAVAAQFGRSKAWVSNLIVLLRLTSELQEKVRAGELPPKVARDIARKPEADQAGVFEAWQAAAAGRRRGRPKTGERTTVRVVLPTTAPVDDVVDAVLAGYDRRWITQFAQRLNTALSVNATTDEPLTPQP